MSRQYTQEEQDKLDRVAQAAARREYETDPNRLDPKHTQDRVEAKLHELRVQMGLERD